MKKQFVFIAALSATIFSVNAQTWNIPSITSPVGTSSTSYIGTTNTTGTNQFLIKTGNLQAMKFYLPTSGTTPFIGIGTQSQTPSYPLSFGPGLANTKLALWEDGSGSGLAYGLGIQGGQFRFHLPNNLAKFSFLDAQSGNEIVTINGNGYMGIGTGSAAPSAKLHVGGGATGNAIIEGTLVIGKNKTNPVNNTPAGYRLYVEDGIITEQLKVALKTSSNWSDYVFADDYKLQSLKEVENFVKTNKHLPGVPSAEEVVKNGINVAEMDAKLLEKIEELTLYVVEQNKKIEVLQAEVSQLKK